MEMKNQKKQIRPQTRIRKGKDFENKIAQAIEESGLGMARRETGSGSGMRKGDIATSIPFLIEAKNHNSISLQEWIRQAKRQAEIGFNNSDRWAVVMRNPASPQANPEIWITIDFYQFLDIMKRWREPKIKEPDRQLKWKLQKLKEIANQVIKEIE